MNITSENNDGQNKPKKTDKRELKKAVEVIHMSVKLTLTQKRMFNNLVFYAFHELSTKEYHQVSASRLINDIKFDSRNFKALRDALKAVMRSLVEYDILGGSAERGWKGMPLLSEVEILDGVVTYSFPRQLRALLDNPKVYASINLQMQNSFNSTYSMSLYETCVRFKNVRSTGEIDLAIWRKLLGAEEETYSEFKYLNNMIIKPSVKEINSVSDIVVTPEYIKRGRFVVAIKFLIEEKEGSKFAELTFEQNRVNILRDMLSIGVNDTDALRYLDKYPIEYVKDNLLIVIDRIKNGKVKIDNYAAYFANALEKDYRKKKPVIDSVIAKEKEEKMESSKEKKNKEQEMEEQLKKESSAKTKKAKELFKNASTDEKIDLEIKFSEWLSSYVPQVYTVYCKSGLSGSPMVLSTFEQWLVKTYLGDK